MESLRLLPRKSALVHVELEDNQDLRGPVLLESNQELVEAEEIRLGGSLVSQTEGKYAVAMFSNLEVWNVDR